MKTWTSDQVIDYAFSLMTSHFTWLVFGMFYLDTPWFWLIFLNTPVHLFYSVRLFLASQARLREGKAELKENLAVLDASVEKYVIQHRFQDDLKEALDAIEANLADIAYHDCPCGTRGVRLYVPSKLHWMVLCPEGHHSVDTTRNGL